MDTSEYLRQRRQGNRKSLIVAGSIGLAFVLGVVIIAISTLLSSADDKTTSEPEDVASPGSSQTDESQVANRSAAPESTKRAALALDGTDNKRHAASYSECADIIEAVLGWMAPEDPKTAGIANSKPKEFGLQGSSRFGLDGRATSQSELTEGPKPSDKGKPVELADNDVAINSIVGNINQPKMTKSAGILSWNDIAPRLVPTEHSATVTRVCVKSYPWPWGAFSDDSFGDDLQSVSSEEFARHLERLDSLLAQFDEGATPPDPASLSEWERKFGSHLFAVRRDLPEKLQEFQTQVRLYGRFFYCGKLMRSQQFKEVLATVDEIRKQLGISVVATTVDEYEKATYYSAGTLANLIAIYEVLAKTQVYSDVGQLLQTTAQYLDDRDKLEDTREIVRSLPDPKDPLLARISHLELAQIMRYPSLVQVVRNRNGMEFRLKGAKTHRIQVAANGALTLMESMP